MSLRSFVPSLSFLLVSLSTLLWVGCGDDDPEGTADSGTTQDGSASNPDGSASNPDGSASNPDGSASNPDGSASNPDGSANNPDGSANNPDGSVTTPDASVTNDAGAIGTTCQDTVCSGSTPQCCITFEGGTCITEGAECAGLTASCDGAEDCPGSEVCCGSLQDGTACAATCNDQQICNDKSDCSDGDDCCSFMGLGICFANCPGL